VDNPAPLGGAFYQIDCGTPISLGTPACILGMTTFCITYCKSGGDSPDYTITATSTVQASNDVIIREGCSANLSVSGLQPASIIWNGLVNPGLYNTYLSCTSGCSTTTVTAPVGSAPATIDYVVSGTPTTSCPGTARDTVRVTIVPGMSATISPVAPVICSGTGSVTLTANPIGGSPPYSYLWSTGETTQSIVVTTPGSYTVNVGDQAGGCPPIPVTVNVTASPTPTDPVVGSNSPVCAGQTLDLTATSTAGATFSWTGPNGFTSSLQNPSITNITAAGAGTYSVTANLGGCLSNTMTISVTVNSSPIAPTAGSNSPICANQTLNLTASNILGATYSWTGPNGFTSTSQNPSIPNATTAASGVYSVTATVAGCPGPAGTVNVTVNPTPTTPTASSNSPICANQTLNLSTPLVAGATYSWTGPNGFSSSLQNPSIASATTAATGTYSVTVTVGGCTSIAGTTAVTVNPIPATPTASSNSPICANQTLNLSTPLVAGATYSWTGPNGFTSTLQNPSIASATTAATGTYSVTITVAGCTSTAGTTAVTVNAIPTTPTASSNSPVCQASTINLSTPLVAGATYSWTGPNGFTSSLQNPTVTNAQAINAGSYSVSITVAGCASAAGSTTVVVNPTPATPTASSSSPDCVGQTLSLTTPLVAGATYSWTGPNGFTSSSQNPAIPNVQLVNAGTYSVTTTVGGCTSAAGTTVVVINPIPATPTASSNSPICANQTLNLSTPLVAGATYSWTGPSGYTSTAQNPSRPNATVAMSGNYNVTITVSGCTSAAGTTAVTVNTTPATPTASSNSPICANQTLNLSTPLVASATYSWTGPNGFTSSLQNPSIASATTAATGTYSVTVTVGGCTSIAGTTAVTVNPIPATPTVSSNSPICANQTLNLSTPLVAGATYSWTGPNGFTSTLQNPSIASATIAATGTYSITITVSGCSSIAGTTAVTVNPIPSAPTASSNSPVCEGTTLNLSASNIASATYSWTGPGGFTSTSQNPSISNMLLTNAGTYSVTATVSGCTSVAGTTSVTVNPIPTTPTASSSSPDCIGQTLSLTTPLVAGATYSWTGPNGFTSSSQNPTIPNVQLVNAGTYSVTITVNGCTSAAGTTIATVNSAPSTPIPGSNSPVCEGQTINLTSNLIVGATYSWTGPNGFTSTLQNPSITNAQAINAGTYTVIADNGCASTPATTNVVVNPTPATPTASSSSPDCVGQTISLSTPLVAGATYSWTGPNGFTSSSQNPSIANAQLTDAGTYSVTVTVGGCTSAAGTINVVVNPIPATPIANSNSPICATQTLSLTTTAVAGATYAWSGPSGYSSAVQNPNRPNATVAMSGIYSLTVTVNGCTSAAGTINVTVNPKPATPVASSNSPVCSGNTLNLSSTTIGSSTYAWTGPNSFTSSTQNPSISNITTAGAGIYSVIATENGCSSNAGTTTVIVNPTPATPTATSDSPVCLGQTFNLSTPLVAGATYSWSGPNGFSSSLQNPSVSNAQVVNAGTYSVIVTVNSCPSAAGTTDVIVNTAPVTPTAGSNSPICSGQNIDLTCTTVAGATYSWSGPNGFTSTLQNPSVTNVQSINAGTYTVIADNGCASSPATTSVVVNATPATPTVTSSSPDCVGQTLALNTPLVAGATYSWSGPNGFTSSLQNPSIPNVQTTDAGTYSVTVTVNGCTSSAGTSNVVINPIPATPTANNNGPVCEGQTLILLTPTVSGATYSWSGPGGFTSSTQNPNRPNATMAMAGNYSVTITVGGCASALGSTSVTILPTPIAPTATNNGPLCEGTTLNLEASTVAGATYDWTGPNGFTSSNEDPSINNITIADAGVYSVTVTVGGCTSLAANTTAVINPIPAAPIISSNSPICVGSDLNLTSNLISGATYSWIGPNGFTSSLQNTTITSATSAATGNYDLTVTVNGCSNVSSLSASVNTAPVLPVASSNSPACVGADLNLFVDPIAGATYSWSGPNGFTSTQQNPTITSVTSAAAGTYTVIADNGCASNPASTTVVINPTPATPNPNSSSPDCEGQTLSLTTALVAGATYSWTGPNGFTSSLQNPTIPNLQITDAGTYSLIVTVNGCTSAIGTENVVVNQPANANAGSNQTVCANNNSVSLNGIVTDGSSTGIWSTSGTGTFTPTANNLNATYNPSVADTTSGTVTLTLTTTGTPGCTADVSSITLTITDAPIADAGTDQTVCKNNAIATLSGFVSDAGGGIWTSSGSGTFSNDTDLNSTYTASAADTTAGSVMLILNTTGNGTCFGDADTMILSFSVSPTVDAGTDLFECLSSPNSSLSGTVNGATTTGIWTTSGTGTFNPNANSLNATYIPSNADTTAGSVTLTLTSTNNNGCNAVSDQMTISYTTVPNVTAGNDQTVCANNANISLNGTIVGGGGNGIWTTSGSGTFSPSASDLNANYSPSAADTTSGSVTLTLTSTTGCAVDSDQLTLTITDGPNANAGADIFVCENNPNAILNGAVNGATSTGDWSTTGTGTFSNGISSLNNTYVPSPGDISTGSVTVYLTTTNNGTCFADVDTLIITYTPPPSAFAGSDTSICANASMQLSGVITGGSASGIWTTSGTGTFSPNANSLNAIYIASVADTTAGNVVLTLTSTNNGGCIAATDQLSLTLTDAPTVNAGVDQNLCSNNSMASINGIITDATGGQWSTSGGGSFADAFSLNTTYTPDTSDINNGRVELILTSTGNGTCFPVTDTVVINFFEAPIVDAGVDIFVCFGTMTANLNGSVSGITTTGNWTTTGSGTFSPNSTVLNGNYDLSVADTSAGSVILVLESTNNNGCLAITDTVIITMTSIPSVSAGVDSTVCGNNANITLNGSVIGGGGTGIWTTSGTGTFSPNASDLNATYIPSSADTTAGNVILTLEATNSCVLVNDDLTITYTTSPVVDAGSDQAFCNQNTVTLNGTINSVPMGAVWSTNGGGTFASSTSDLNNSYTIVASDSTLNPLQFYLTSFGSGTCFEITDTMNVFLSGTPNAEFIVENACENQNVLFNDTSTVSPGNISSWNWDFGNGDTSSLENPIASYSTSGDYTVTLIIQTSGGCSDTVSHNVHINSTPNADFSFVDGCVNDILFTDNSSIGTGSIITYDWTFGDGNVSTIPSPNNVYADTGSYNVTLTVTSDSLCTNSSTQVVNILPQPIAGFTMNANCGTTVVNFADTSIVMNDSIVDYNWIFTNGNGANASNVSNDFGTFGIADATLIVTTASGCIDTASVSFTLNDNPVADFIPVNSTFMANEIIDFFGDPDNMASYQWDFGDSLGTSMQQDTSYSYANAGTFIVILTVTDSLGCSDTTSHTYQITMDTDSTGNVGVPTAFTPNGDNVNDILYVRGGPLTELSFTIFNEWGNQIFFTDDQSRGWDGKYKSKSQPGGVYVYILKATSVTGEEIDMTGHVTLIR
jgi:gliding motility-associated-like protein